MARNFEEILTEINQEQANFSELNGLNSPSADSFWNLIKKMFAFLVRTLELGFDKYKSEVNDLIAAQQIGTLQWYVAQVKSFQYGDLLQINENRVFYTTEDTNKQIIKQASASEVQDGNKAKIIIKAVKEDGSILAPLDIDELDALKEYIKKIKFAGVLVETISLQANIIKLKIEVQINRLMLNADGSQIGEPTIYPVKNAIVEYLRSLPFDGTFYWTQLTDKIQAMPEVKDVVVQQSWYWNGTTFVEFTRAYAPPSGHLLLDETTIFNYVL